MLVITTRLINYRTQKDQIVIRMSLYKINKLIKITIWKKNKHFSCAYQLNLPNTFDIYLQYLSTFRE